MKRKVILLVVLSLMLVSVGQALANNGASEVLNAEKKLLEMGFPQKQIDQMPDSYKIEMASIDGKYVGSETLFINFNEDGNVESMYKFTDESEEITLSYLPESDLSITINAVKVSNPFYSNTVQFSLGSYFNWNRTPFYGFTDHIGLAWNKDFSILFSGPNPPRAHYSYVYGGNQYHENMNTPSETEPGVGLSFPINIRSYGTNHQGWMSANIFKTYTGAGDANAVARYMHAKVAWNPTITFSKSPSISISPSTYYMTSGMPGAELVWD